MTLGSVSDWKVLNIIHCDLVLVLEEQTFNHFNTAPSYTHLSTLATVNGLSKLVCGVFLSESGASFHGRTWGVLNRADPGVLEDLVPGVVNGMSASSSSSSSLSKLAEICTQRLDNGKRMANFRN